MLYFLFFILSLIIIYLILLFYKKNYKKTIVGIVEEVNKNFILVKSNDRIYFVQVTKETYFDGASWKDIKPSQNLSIEHTDLIATSNHYQTFGKKIKIAN